MKPGDLVKIYDPDENQMDGIPYSVVGILIKINQKTSNVNAHRIFTIYVEGGERDFDEPFWAASLINSA